MRREAMIRKLLYTVVGTIAVCSASYAKPTIAVMDFTVVSKAVRLGPDFTEIRWGETNSDILTSDLITALVNTRKFDVVERDRMQEIMQEKDFISMTQNEAIKLGNLLGADYFVMGQIELVEAGVSKKRIPYTESYKVDTSGRMVVNVRIVDTRGGKIVAAQKINQSHGHSGAGSTLAFLETLKEMTVKRIVNSVVDGVFPVKVMKVTGNEIYLNRGTGAPFSKGSVLVIYVEGEQLVDPDTGEKLGSTEIEVGKIKITEILQKFSKAELISGELAAIKEGATCRTDSVEPAPKPKKPTTPGSSEKPIQW